MKLKKLTREFGDLLEKRDKGEKLKSEKFRKILSLLEKKKAHYENKLQSSTSEKDRHLLEVKLKVVDIQIGKLKTMVGDDP